MHTHTHTHWQGGGECVFVRRRRRRSAGQRRPVQNQGHIQSTVSPPADTPPSILAAAGAYVIGHVSVKRHVLRHRLLVLQSAGAQLVHSRTVPSVGANVAPTAAPRSGIVLSPSPVIMLCRLLYPRVSLSACVSDFGIMLITQVLLETFVPPSWCK